MLDPNHPIAKLAREDGRYRVDAYAFVFEALNHAHREMGMGQAPERSAAESKNVDQLLLSEELEIPSADVTEEMDCPEKMGDTPEDFSGEMERHVTGQQLCLAIRSLALEQYGYMAKCVLNSWGVHQTGDFGNIVFNLIQIGQMKKTDRDRREDFENVFDFDRELVEKFSIPPAAE